MMRPAIATCIGVGVIPAPHIRHISLQVTPFSIDRIVIVNTCKQLNLMGLSYDLKMS